MSNISRLTFYHLNFISILILVFLLFNTSVFGQSDQNINWEETLSSVKGKDRVDLLEQLSKDLTDENLLMAESFAIEGIALAKQLGDSLSIYRLGANLGTIYIRLHKIKEGYIWAEKSLSYFNQYKNLAFDKAKIQLTLAIFQSRKRNFIKADSLILKSADYFKNTNDLFWQSKVLMTKGIISQDKLNYKKALRYYTKALERFSELGDIAYRASLMRNIGVMKSVLGLYPEALELQFQVTSMDCSNYTRARSYHDIGVIYFNLEDWRPAINYTEKAIKWKKRVGLESSLAYSLYQMANIHYKQLNFGEALKYSAQSLTLFKKYNIDKKIGEVLGIMGNINNDLGNSDKANVYYDEQLELAKSKNDWQGVWLVYYNRGFYTYETKQYNEALKHLLKSYQIAEEKEHLPYLLKNNAMLANTYDKLPGQKTKAKFHEEQYYLIEDSIKNFQKIKKIGALEQEYNSKIQEGNDITFSQSSETISISKNLVWLGLLALIIVAAFLFFKRPYKNEDASTEDKVLDQLKIDQYFQKLFVHLEQNKKTFELNNGQSPQTMTLPVNDMADFLKTNLKSPSDWESFVKYFDKIHKNFFKNLKSDYPTITINELNMCALLKLNLLNKEIAQIMGIGHNSVRVAQNRLSKKLNLPAGSVLRDFVLKI